MCVCVRDVICLLVYMYSCVCAYQQIGMYVWRLSQYMRALLYVCGCMQHVLSYKIVSIMYVRFYVCTHMSTIGGASFVPLMEPNFIGAPMC